MIDDNYTTEYIRSRTRPTYDSLSNYLRNYLEEVRLRDTHARLIINSPKMMQCDGTGLLAQEQETTEHRCEEGFIRASGAQRAGTAKVSRAIGSPGDSSSCIGFVLSPAFSSGVQVGWPMANQHITIIVRTGFAIRY
jgi:hypothetical protein